MNARRYRRSVWRLRVTRSFRARLSPKPRGRRPRPADDRRGSSRSDIIDESSKKLVENCPVPLAVVNGSEDPFINLDYLEVPKYANLWEGRCHRLPGLKHAPFWEAPDVFDELLARFIDDVAAR